MSEPVIVFVCQFLHLFVCFTDVNRNTCSLSQANSSAILRFNTVTISRFCPYFIGSLLVDSHFTINPIEPSPGQLL